MSGEYDVILLDMMMPGVLGIDILKEVKAAGIASEVIIITGHAHHRIGGRGHEVRRSRLHQQAVLTQSGEDGCPKGLGAFVLGA